MRVRALKKCFVGNCLREPGDEFSMPDDANFSSTVIELVEDETPVEKPVAKVAKKAAKKAKKAPEPTEES